MKSKYEYLDLAQEKLSASHLAFLRNITTVSVGFFGLLVGLKPKIIIDFNAKIAFFITIIFIGIGILFSVITQYSDIYLRKKEIDIRRKNIRVKKTSNVTFIPEPIIFKYSEVVTYISLGLSLVSLVLYVYMVEF